MKHVTHSKYPLIAIFFAITACLRTANAGPIPEYEMKAAYLYNLATFTTWPAQTNKQVRLCVLGRDRFGGALEELTHNTLSGVHISLTYLPNLQAIKSCQIMFIDVSERENIPEILKQLDKLPILTVTDNAELYNAGVIVGLFLDNNKLSFDVNYQLAQNASLSISSKLLRVARNVRQ